MHLSKKTAIGIVIALIGFELALISGCVHALARSDFGKTLLQALIAPSAAQAASKRLFVRFNPSQFQKVAYTLPAQQEAPEQPYAVRQAAAQEKRTGQYLYGHPKARFTLVEFSDFECLFCKSFHHTLKRLVEASQGQVNWQWKHLPLHPPTSRQLAKAAECVAQQKGNRGFWKFAEALFAHTRGNGAGVPNLEALLKHAGIHFPRYRACLRSGKAAARIETMRQEALALGIDGTPATLVIDHATGNRQLIRGMQSAQNVIAALQRMLINARQTAPKTSIQPSDHPVTADKAPKTRRRP